MFWCLEWGATVQYCPLLSNVFLIKATTGTTCALRIRKEYSESVSTCFFPNGTNFRFPQSSREANRLHVMCPEPNSNMHFEFIKALQAWPTKYLLHFHMCR